jgi:hypothetical protein
MPDEQPAEEGANGALLGNNCAKKQDLRAGLYVYGNDDIKILGRLKLGTRVIL